MVMLIADDPDDDENDVFVTVVRACFIDFGKGIIRFIGRWGWSSIECDKGDERHGDNAIEEERRRDCVNWDVERKLGMVLCYE